MQRERGGRGWYDFAGAMLGIAGFFNGFHGLGAIFRKEHFDEASLIFGNLQLWGWVWLVIGVVQIGTAIALFDGRGRVMGMVLAGLSAVFAFASLGAAPVGAAVVIAIDVLVIHGLSRHPDPQVDIHAERAAPSRPPGRDLPTTPR